VLWAGKWCGALAHHRGENKLARALITHAPVILSANKQERAESVQATDKAVQI
jgi:hypothetical protein